MNLTITDRLSLLAVLPSTGDLTELKILRKLKESLSLSEDEFAHYAVKSTQDKDGLTTFRWDQEKDVGTDILIGPVAMGIIVKTLDGLNGRKQLTDNLVDVFEKFHPEED